MCCGMQHTRPGGSKLATLLIGQTKGSIFCIYSCPSIHKFESDKEGSVETSQGGELSS